MKKLTNEKITELSTKFRKEYDSEKKSMTFDAMLIIIKRLEEQNDILKQILDKP